jgi:hypothetical protein
LISIRTKKRDVKQWIYGEKYVSHNAENQNPDKTARA